MTKKTNLEDKISSLPPLFTHTDGNSSGFCLRYSFANKKWRCSYGYDRGHKGKYTGWGETPTEAVDNFIVLIRTSSNK